jgi:PKHD-type hydroxylase
VDNIFTPEQCAQIIDLGNTKLQPATTLGLNNDWRKSQVAWLYATDIEFAFRQMTGAILTVNERFFKFDLFGLAEGLQFTRYDAPTDHYGMHADKIYNNVVRKLSVTIQLSNPEDYEGGELVLHQGKDPVVMPKELGKMIVFPSWALHEVRPVTKGTRYSLVAWVTGKPFK